MANTLSEHVMILPSYFTVLKTILWEYQDNRFKAFEQLVIRE